MIQRIIDFFRKDKSRELDSLDLSDPFQELPHPGNQELFTALKPAQGHHFGSYSAHPDLADHLFSLAPSQKTMKAYVYGYPVMANAEGLVFSLAHGRWSVLIKLQERHHKAAGNDRGRINAEYGKNWIEFPAYGEPSGSSSRLQKNMSEHGRGLRYWMQVSYEDSLR